MEGERFNLLTALLKSRRVVEWSIVTAVLIGLVWALERQVNVVRGQGERVAVRSTLASLRAALVIEQLMAQVRTKDAVAATTVVAKNPFTLLQGVPANYAGELAQRDIFSAPQGSWVYDPECGCVGYRLLYAEWLEPPQTAGTIWLRVGAADGEPRLEPMGSYRWLGQSLN